MAHKKTITGKFLWWRKTQKHHSSVRAKHPVDIGQSGKDLGGVRKTRRSLGAPMEGVAGSIIWWGRTPSLHDPLFLKLHGPQGWFSHCKKCRPPFTAVSETLLSCEGPNLTYLWCIAFTHMPYAIIFLLAFLGQLYVARDTLVSSPMLWPWSRPLFILIDVIAVVFDSSSWFWPCFSTDSCQHMIWGDLPKFPRGSSPHSGWKCPMSYVLWASEGEMATWPF